MRSIGNPEDFSFSLILDYLIADVHIFLGDGGDGGVACDGDRPRNLHDTLLQMCNGWI